MSFDKNYLRYIRKTLNLLPLLFYLNISVAQETLLTNNNYGLVTCSPSDVFLNHQRLLESHLTIPIPLDFYSEAILNRQKKINDQISDALISFETSDGHYQKNNIDSLEITPFTWRWIDLELEKSDGTVSKINLRRPNSWFIEMGIEKEGERFFLRLPEMGMSGWAVIKAIRINQLDTRLWNSEDVSHFTKRPITGKFEHASQDVYELQFQHELLEATGEHPFWSFNRNQWVEAKKLRVGERIKSYHGETRLLSLSKKEGWYTVYNLEIYKDHTYIVSSSKVVVHNACIGDRTVKDIVKSNILPAAGQLTVDRSFIEKTATRMEEMVKDSKYVDWEEITRNASDGPIQAVQYTDGTIVVINGRHRVLAAELAGVEIPWYNPKVAELTQLNYTFAEGGYYAGSWENIKWGKGKTFEVIRRRGDD